MSGYSVNVCDECGKEERADVHGWLHVQYAGWAGSDFALDPSLDWDYCSEACLLASMKRERWVRSIEDREMSQ